MIFKQVPFLLLFFFTNHLNLVIIKKDTTRNIHNTRLYYKTTSIFILTFIIFIILFKAVQKLD